VAIFMNLVSNEEVNLLTMHQFGRHKGCCDTILTNPKTSRVHATVSWDGQHWIIQDNSINGTFVNDQKLPANSAQLLQRNDKIRFANQPQDEWLLTDISAPKSMLIPQTANAPLVILEDMVVLPNEDNPELTIYLSLEGHWICESNIGSFALTHGSKVNVKGMIWQFAEATEYEQTIPIEQIKQNTEQLSLLFEVSQDEEHVNITVNFDKHSIELGERSHHYLILLLARQYLQDRENERVIEGERGWITTTELMKELRTEETTVNMQIYRFRKQLLKIKPDDMVLAQLIERRKGQVRLVCEQLDIKGGFHALS